MCENGRKTGPACACVHSQGSLCLVSSLHRSSHTYLVVDLLARLLLVGLELGELDLHEAVAAR